MSFAMVPIVKERNMRGPLSEDRREPWSELKVGDLLSVLAFGASLEEIAKFLIDNVVEREIIKPSCLWAAKENRVVGRTDRDATSDWPFSGIER
jgi:hypothetical protein